MRVTYEDVKRSEDIRTYITQADASLIALGFTEHSFAHVTRCAEVAGDLLEELGYDEHQIELCKIAAYMHDIGNVVNRHDHNVSGATMAFRILDNMGMEPEDVAAVITAIVDGHDRLLLQHNAAWKDSRLYSVSAGFVEAGENLEHACRREAMEETGIKLGEVRYLGSQPWPFPASLMMAFKAHAIATDVRVDGEETMTARWVTRDEYTAELIAGRMVAPGRATIARYMIEEWLGREL